MTLQVLAGPVIRAGESLSEGVDCTKGEPVRITMPIEWTDAPLSFLISSDGVMYNEVFDIEGYELVVKTVIPRSAVIIGEHFGRAVSWLKVRSGTRMAPVVQEVERTFALVILEDLPLGGPKDVLPEASR